MKLRGTKDLSIAAVGKYGTLQEFSFFDKVSRRGRPPQLACAGGRGAGSAGEGAGARLSQHWRAGAAGSRAWSPSRVEHPRPPLWSCVAFLKQGRSRGSPPGAVTRAGEGAPGTRCPRHASHAEPAPSTPVSVTALSGVRAERGEGQGWGLALRGPLTPCPRRSAGC